MPILKPWNGICVANLGLDFDVIRNLIWDTVCLSTGQRVVVVRCEGINISGNFYRNKRKFGCVFNGFHVLVTGHLKNIINQKENLMVDFST